MKYIPLLKGIFIVKKWNNKLRYKKEVRDMKMIKGIMIGGLLTTGMLMMYSEASNQTKKKVMKKGRNMLKKMGIM